MEVIDKYGNVKCDCGREMSPFLTDGISKCIFCYCCKLLGEAIVCGDGEFGFDGEFYIVTKWRYEDDGDGYIDRMEDKTKELKICPYGKKDLMPFINNYAQSLLNKS